MKGERRPVLKVDKLTWRPVARFETVGEAAAESGLSWYFVYQTASRRSLPRGRYAYRFEDGFDPGERLDHRKNEPVDVTDVMTGRRYRVPSASSLADQLGIPYNTAKSAMCTGRLLSRRYRVERTA